MKIHIPHITGSLVGNLSGSATSTASFGSFEGGGSGITGVTDAAALPKAGGAMTGAITTNSTFDGVDIATRDAILTSTTTTAGAALPKAGGTMTGELIGTTATFESLTTTGDITAQNYIVSSSVTYMTQSFSSGSTIFGDDSADTHKFTGSLQISGGLSVNNGTLGGTLSTAAQPNVTSLGTLGSLEVNNGGSSAAQITVDGTGASINGTTIGESITATGKFTAVTTSGNVSGSSVSTGSFGHLMVEGANFTSASLAATGSGGGGGSVTQSFSDGTAALISGSLVSTGSFGAIITRKITTVALTGSLSKDITSVGTDMRDTLPLHSGGSVVNDTISSSLASNFSPKEIVIKSELAHVSSSHYSGSLSDLEGTWDWNRSTEQQIFQAAGAFDVLGTSVRINYTNDTPGNKDLAEYLEANKNDSSISAILEDSSGNEYTVSAANIAASYYAPNHSWGNAIYLTVGSGHGLVSGTSTLKITVPGQLEAMVEKFYDEKISISGSANSTGSFGRLEGDGSGLTGIAHTTTQSFSDGTATTISGSLVSTGSFGHIMVGGGNFTSTSLASSGGGGGSVTQSFSDGTAALISGSLVSTGSFGRVQASKIDATKIFFDSTRTEFSYQTPLSDVDISFVGYSNGGAISGLAEDDLLIYIVASKWDPHPATDALDDPDLFTWIREDFNGTMALNTYYRVVPATVPTSFTDVNGQYGSHMVVAFRGIDTSTPFDVTATSTTGTSTTPDPTSITTVNNKAVVLAAVAVGGNTQTFSAAPTGYGDLSQVSHNASYTKVAAAWKEVGTAGAENPGSFTMGISYAWIAHTIAIRKYVASSQVNDYSLGNLGQALSGGVSGSAVSTGSFGRVEGDGSGLTGITHTTTQSFSDGTATTISGSLVSTGSFGRVKATDFIGSFDAAFEEDSVGNLMPVNGYVNNNIWMITGSINDELCLRSNYFKYPDWEIFAISGSVTEEQLESVVFG